MHHAPSTLITSHTPGFAGGTASGSAGGAASVSASTGPTAPPSDALTTPLPSPLAGQTSPSNSPRAGTPTPPNPPVSSEPSDPRLHLLLAGCYGVLVWHLPPLGLAVVAAGLAGLFAATPLRRRRRPGMLRGHAWFVLVWVALRFALACLGPAEPSASMGGGDAGPGGVLDALRFAWPDAPLLAHAARESALLGVRLALLIGIGLALALAASPRALGLALVWLLRPVLGARAWQPALGVALMIHFLPMAQGTFAQISRAADLRGPLPLRRRAVLLPTAVLRILGQRTWTQTVAVAARGLDRPEAWRPDFPFRPARWVMTALLVGLGVGMTFLPG